MTGIMQGLQRDRCEDDLPFSPQPQPGSLLPQPYISSQTADCINAKVIASNRLYVGAFEAFQDIAADAYGVTFTFVVPVAAGMTSGILMPLAHVSWRVCVCTYMSSDLKVLVGDF